MSQRVGPGYGVSNPNVKNAGEMCVKCEDYARRLLDGCADGCHRFKASAIPRDKGRFHYRMLCPKCEEWKSVGAAKGFACPSCGLSCNFASEVNQSLIGKRVDRVIGRSAARGIEGPILNYEVDDREKDEDF